MAQERTRIIAGCMTGTSLDGLDVALVRVIGTGLEMRAELIAHHAVDMPDRLRSMLMSFAQGEAAEPVAFMRAARALGRLHLEALQALLAGGFAPPSTSTNLDFVTAHGQTIWHAPSDAPRYDAASGPKSWQLFDPWPIVRGLKVPVCYDLRQADLIAGGEGAPLTPIADWVMYRSAMPRTVVNLGGICNATFLGVQPPSGIDASDCFACNILIDGVTQRLFPSKRYDVNGIIASKGSVLDFGEQFLNEQWAAFDKQFGVEPCSFKDRDGSMGRELFNAQWVEEFIGAAPQGASHEDILCTAVDCVVRYIPYCAGEILLAGGGARNNYLVKQIKNKCPPGKHVKRIMLSDSLGIPCEACEAMGFAVLGALSQDGVPISLPQVTGATDPGIAGVWAGV